MQRYNMDYCSSQVTTNYKLTLVEILRFHEFFVKLNGQKRIVPSRFRHNHFRAKSVKVQP